jgi:hypothetical protein
MHDKFVGGDIELSLTPELQIPPGPGQTQTLKALHGVTDLFTKEYQNIRHCFVCTKHFPSNEQLQRHIPEHEHEIKRRTELREVRKAFQRAQSEYSLVV